jgi:hypothetical protein
VVYYCNVSLKKDFKRYSDKVTIGRVLDESDITFFPQQQQIR